jgi:GTP-binding protein HflX
LTKLIETAVRKKTAIMVGVITQQQDEEMAREYLDELKFLIDTWGAVTLKGFLQKMTKPDSKYFVGSGKLQEIKTYVKEFAVDMVVFDDDLSPSQLRNIEKILETKVLDRSDLIIDIFAARAQTAHAKTQVELALYQHILPRLTGMWTHLERQRGGTGTRGGAGEKEIETDRRIVRNKITLLKERLKEIDKQMATQRKNR